MIVTIASIRDISKVRILLTALKAHGFHPMEGGEEGLPGMPGITGTRGGISIRVPEQEAEDAKLLCDALIKDMHKE